MKAASKLLANTMFSYRGMGLSMVRCGRWDLGSDSCGVRVCASCARRGRGSVRIDGRRRGCLGRAVIGGEAAGGARPRKHGSEASHRRPWFLALRQGTMIAGWDLSGPGLYYVDSDGQRTGGQRFSVGSGSLYAYGVLDSGYSWDMSVEDAIELGQRSIYHATCRDAASGGTASGARCGRCWLLRVRGR